MTQEDMRNIKKSWLFRTMKDEEMQQAAQRLCGQKRKFSRGQILIHEGDVQESVGILLSGEVRISRFTMDGTVADAHENTARIRFYHTDGSQSEIEGSSIGGGRILITRIDGMPAGFSAEAPTLLITQRDVKGVVSEISRTLAMEDINIGVMRVSREARGSLATTVIETDSPIPRRVADRLRLMPDILSVRIVDLAQ